MEAFGEAMASANAPCSFISMEVRFRGCTIRFVLDDIMTMCERINVPLSPRLHGGRRTGPTARPPRPTYGRPIGSGRTCIVVGPWHRRRGVRGDTIVVRRIPGRFETGDNTFSLARHDDYHGSHRRRCAYPKTVGCITMAAVRTAETRRRTRHRPRCTSPHGTAGFGSRRDRRKTSGTRLIAVIGHYPS